jgi:isopentenyl phosphate kinase
MTTPRMVFVKLGGAAITDKTKALTALPDRIEDLAGQIARVWKDNPGMQLVIGHGSGSFGHSSAQRNNTKNGVSSPKEWLGFAEVWDDARRLNELVMHALLSAGLPVIAFPPSAWIVTENRRPVSYLTEPIQTAVKNGLIPVVNGDTIIDRAIGGTILSTEDVFALLAAELHPGQIILASREPGVWRDFPINTQLAESFSLPEFESSSVSTGLAVGMDVTGGMAKKIALMMDILRVNPAVNIQIISGMDDHSVYDAMQGRNTGTRLQLQ